MTLPHQAGLRNRARVSPALDARSRRNAALDIVGQDYEEPIHLTPAGKIGWRKEGIFHSLKDSIQEPLYVTDDGKLAIRLGDNVTLDSDNALTLDLDLTTDA